MRTMPPIIKTAQASAGGAATVTLQDPGISYTISQISVSASGGQGSANVYLNGVFVLGTTTGWADSADGPPPIDVGPGDALSIVWAGAAPGAACVAQFMGMQNP